MKTSIDSCQLFGIFPHHFKEEPKRFRLFTLLNDENVFSLSVKAPSNRLVTKLTCKNKQNKVETKMHLVTINSLLYTLFSTYTTYTTTITFLSLFLSHNYALFCSQPFFVSTNTCSLDLYNGDL